MKDNIKKIVCPACGKEMEKVYIDKAGFFLDVCLDGCGGIWFDNMELNKLSRFDDILPEISKIYGGREFKDSYTKRKRLCPLCKRLMIQNYENFSRKVLIDQCYTCGGKFLDYGELEESLKDELPTEFKF